MDLEFRELQRHYRAHPTWSTGYRLLRLNERMTGELIGRDTLRRFALVNLIAPFTDVIETLHAHEYGNAPVDEWELYGPEGDQLQFNAMLQDDEKAVQEGFIPSVSDHPFKLMVTIILRNDIQYGAQGIGGFYPGFYGGASPTSTAFGRRVDSSLQWTLSSNTRGTLRRFVRNKFNYDPEYAWSNEGPWGFHDVLPIPKGDWNAEENRNEENLILIYTFFPDSVLWNLLIDMEFRNS